MDGKLEGSIRLQSRASYSHQSGVGPGKHGDENLTRKDIMATVSRIIGPIAKPDKIQFVTGLPKTRSGKIMRKILRKIAEGDTSNLGDISTLLDRGVWRRLRRGLFKEFLLFDTNTRITITCYERSFISSCNCFINTSFSSTLINSLSNTFWEP